MLPGDARRENEYSGIAGLPLSVGEREERGVPGVGLQVVIIFLLIVANGLFAMAEMAVAASRKTRLQQRAEEGDAGARAALELANAPSRFLSTTQIGITLIGILTGAFGGASLAAYVARGVERLPLLAPYSAAIGLGVVVLAITYVSLIVGELVPTQLALGNPEGIAAMLARPMQLLATVASPAVRLLSASTELVVRLLGVRPSGEPAVTEEEIRILIGQGTRAGVFQTQEEELVERVFELGDAAVVELMTPRPRIVWLDVEAPDAENWRLMAASGHTFYPVCEGELDRVLGLVSIKDLWAGQVGGQPVELREALHRPLFVPERGSAFKLLEVFKQSGAHIALVVDEYGGIEGLITLIDILEALVGDVPAARDGEEPPAVRRDDGTWLVDGLLPVDDLAELFPQLDFPDDVPGDYQTLSGLAMARLARIPSAGDHFDWADLRFEVLDMDGNRVDKVLVRPSSSEPDPPVAA